MIIYNEDTDVSRVITPPACKTETATTEILAPPHGKVGTPFNVDTGEFELGEPDRDYRRYILTHDCVVCGLPGVQAQRIQLEGWWCAPGQELSDAYLVPLCSRHHLALARATNKNRWWSKVGIRPVQEATWRWECYHAAVERWMQRSLDNAEKKSNEGPQLK